MLAPVLRDDEIAQITSLLEQRFGLEALLVFGSEARGDTHRESDVDLAALFHRRPGAIELMETRADVERILGRAVDLVDLTEASPILARQVLRDGRCVHGADSRALAEFAAILPSRYEDLKRVRAAAEAALLERIRHG